MNHIDIAMAATYRWADEEIDSIDLNVGSIHIDNNAEDTIAPHLLVKLVDGRGIAVIPVKPNQVNNINEVNGPVGNIFEELSNYFLSGSNKADELLLVSEEKIPIQVHRLIARSDNISIMEPDRMIELNQKRLEDEN